MSIYTWKGVAGSGWGTASNWMSTGTGLPGANDTVNFNDTTPGVANAVNLGGGVFSLRYLNLDGPQDGGGYVFQNGTLDFTTGGEIISDTAANSPDLGGTGSVTVNISGSLGIITNYSTSTLGFGPKTTITGNGDLIIFDVGTTTMDDVGSFSGYTEIESGKLTIGNTSALSTGGIDFINEGSPNRVDPVLEAAASGTLSNAFDIEAGADATIEAESGDVLNLTGAFADDGGAGTTLHFGSTGDTGVVVSRQRSAWMPSTISRRPTHCSSAKRTSPIGLPFRISAPCNKSARIL